MAVSETIKSRLLSALIGGLITLGAVVGAALIKESYPTFEADVLPAISKSTLWLLSLLLLTTNLISGAWLASFLWGDKQKRLLKKYTFDTNRGFYRKNGTGEIYCGNCFLYNVESPLARSTDINGNPIWVCGKISCKRSHDRIPGE
jgi:hypothetical protein